MKKFTVAILFALGLCGSAQAGFPEGASAYNARNYTLAMREIAPLARAGNPDAQHLLGLMYYMGRGVARDYKQALRLAPEGRRSRARPTPSTWSAPCTTPATPCRRTRSTP